jgi:hypothetical protein
MAWPWRAVAWWIVKTHCPITLRNYREAYFPGNLGKETMEAGGGRFGAKKWRWQLCDGPG